MSDYDNVMANYHYDRILSGSARRDKLIGDDRNDYIIWHPPAGEDTFAASLIGLNGGDGDDLIEGSMEGYGQIHMRGGTGNDTFILDLSNTEIIRDGDYKGHQAHHVYGGPGRSIYNFTNIAQANGYVAGRIDDLDISQDLLFIEGQALNLTNLPRTFQIGSMSVTVRIVDYQSPDMAAAGLASQQFLLIGDRIAYGLEGARQTTNADGSTKLAPDGSIAEESHFIGWTDVQAMAQLPSVAFVDQMNYVPTNLYNESTLTVISVNGQTEEGTAGDDYIHADKQTTVSSNGLIIHPNNILNGGAGNDVINGGQGQDTIYGGDGNDLLAGGIDSDLLKGGNDNDRVWGGTGNDKLYGENGIDYLYGGNGNDYLNGENDTDFLYGQNGNDRLVGGAGNDKLYGGNGNDSLHGQEGDDYLNGQSGADLLYGYDGNDVLVGGGETTTSTETLMTTGSMVKMAMTAS